jgi:predicted DNA-binding transcriptional regulator AlpA
MATNSHSDHVPRRASTTAPRRALAQRSPRGDAANDASAAIDLSQPLIDADAVAMLLAVKRKRVYELARRPADPLPSVRIGGAVRFVLSHVEEWVSAQASH